MDRLRATLLNIQATAEKGFPIDGTKLATQCRLALTEDDLDAKPDPANPDNVRVRRGALRRLIQEAENVLRHIEAARQALNQ